MYVYTSSIFPWQVFCPDYEQAGNRPPPPPTPFIYHFTFSFALFYYLFSLPWDWKPWGLAAATGGWAVIRDWVVRMGSGLFGRDCIQWRRARFCSQGWRHTVPWSPGHPCAMEHSPSPWEAAGQGAEAWVPRLGLTWVGSCVACSVAVSMYIEVTWVFSSYFPLCGVELAIFIIQIL